MKTKSILLTVVLVCAASATFAATTPPPTPLLTRPAGTLVGVLESSSSRKEKVDACRELAIVGTGKAVPVLARLLADEELSHMARYALETIPGSDVDRALRSELTRLKGRLLIGVIGSLGVRQDSKAVKPLSSLLSDTDPQVAQAAARALGQIGTTGAASAIEKALAKTAPANRLAFCEGLLRCAETFTATGRTRSAITLYDRLRVRSEVPPQVRAGALRGAIVTRGKGGLGLLQESLTASDRGLFQAAVRASLEMSGPEVTRALAASLAQLPADNLIVVMQALGSRGDDLAVSGLAAQAKTGAKTTRVAAIRAVAAIGHSSSVPVMVEAIENSEREISQAALEGLAGIPGREADAAVLSLVKSSKAERRITGIDLVGRRRMASAVPALLTAAADADAKVRSSALQRLGRLGTPAEVPALIKLLSRSTDQPDLDGQAEALSSICTGAGAPASATSQIIAALSGASSSQKRALLGVLAAVGGEKALGSVRAALKDSNAEVRDAAVRALSDWPDAAAAPDLIQIARSPAGSHQRDLAFRGFVRLTRESSAPAAEKLKSLTEASALMASPQDKMLVLAGLGDIPSVESLRLVTPHLADPAVADEAGAAAVKIAEKLDAKNSAEIATALNQVIKSAKSKQVLDNARKRMEQLKLAIE